MKPLCDKQCNECPLINHPNSRMLTAVLNNLMSEIDDCDSGIYGQFVKDVNALCPNLTVCFECRIDDFVHVAGCEFLTHTNPPPGVNNAEAVTVLNVDDGEYPNQ